MAEGVAQLRTTQYGDGGRPFIFSIISYPVLPTAPTIESRRFLWIEKKNPSYTLSNVKGTNEVYILLRYI